MSKSPKKSSANLFSQSGHQWILNESNKVAFFINLHNFLILFSLCEDGKKPLPKTLLEWLQYKADKAINVGRVIFSALEIEHAVLRGSMDSPNIPSPYTDELPFFNKFHPADPRASLKVTKKIKHINFVLYNPTMYFLRYNFYSSSPTLRVYHSYKLQEELKEATEQYFSKTVKYKGKGQLILPELLEWYAEDYYRGFGKQDLASFVFKHIRKDIIGVDNLQPEYFFFE